MEGREREPSAINDAALFYQNSVEGEVFIKASLSMLSDLVLHYYRIINADNIRIGIVKAGTMWFMFLRRY